VARIDPIVLRGSRWRPIGTALAIAAIAAALWGVAVLTEGAARVRAGVSAGFLTVFLVVIAIEWAIAGSRGREVRVDGDGITIGRRRVPWTAVTAVSWRMIGSRGGAWPAIEIRVRRVEGYRPPRSARELIALRSLGIRANVLLDAIVRYARPHSVIVLAVDSSDVWPVSDPGADGPGTLPGP